MSVSFSLDVQLRDDAGKGASRRLRRSGLVPAVIYGGGQDPQSITVSHNTIQKNLQTEAFYSHILELKVDGQPVQAILRDVQRHPSRPVILHLDFLRVREDHEITVNVPLHFTGEDVSIGVKQGGGTVSHVLSEVQISCLPRYLPEYLEVDVSALDVGDSVHLSDIKVPDGVTIVELTYGEEHDAAVASVQILRVAEELDEEAEGEGEEEPGREAADEAADQPDDEGDD